MTKIKQMERNILQRREEPYTFASSLRFEFGLRHLNEKDLWQVKAIGHFPLAETLISEAVTVSQRKQFFL